MMLVTQLSKVTVGCAHVRLVKIYATVLGKQEPRCNVDRTVNLPSILWTYCTEAS